MRLGPDGASQLETWRLAARRGSEAAQAKFDGPPFPEELRYLWGWSLELFGKSGIGQHGISALTWSTLRDWRDVTGRHVSRREAFALMSVDAALRHTDTDDAPVAVEDRPAWPEKKPDG